jgi:hypothetical protein
MHRTHCRCRVPDRSPQGRARPGHSTHFTPFRLTMRKNIAPTTTAPHPLGGTAPSPSVVWKRP